MGEKKINLTDYCDMEKLYSILDNWSKGTGLSAVVVGMDSSCTSESLGMTEICRVIPLVWPDGMQIGRVMAGQTLSEERNDNRKTSLETENAYILLEQMMSLFIERCFNSRKVQRALEKEPSTKDKIFSRITMAGAAKDQLLSGVTKLLYGFNLTVNLVTEKYTLITGNGLENVVEFMKTTDEYTDIYEHLMENIDPEYKEKAIALLEIEHLRKHKGKVGFLDSQELMVHNGNRIEWHELNLFAGVDETGTPIINILGRDMTEAHEKADTKAQLEIARKANEAKSLFLSNMSHDIRTPMNGIIGMAAIASAHIDDQERVKTCLAKIADASRQLVSLINDILDLSKIESGNIMLSEESFSISELLDNTVNMLSSEMESKSLKFKFRVDGVTHERVIGDPLKLQQVFINILGNAIKYTPDGGDITIELRERPTDSAKVAEYEFVCQDTGYGMSEEYLKKLFVPFERAEDVRIKNIQGTGLGMVITRNIVHMMDGDITVESRLDEGSKFTVIFRMKQQDDYLECDEMLKKLKVLIVDDDLFSCRSVQKIISDLGMTADYAVSGQEAIDKVRRCYTESNGYNICLIDLQMPGMDGIETTRQIRQIAGSDDTHIIISASDWSSVESEARRVGANAFLSKPLFRSKILDKFREVAFGEKVNKEKSHELSEYAQKDYSANRILLVEDNDLNREIACAILSETSVNVETAENGKIALDMVEQSEEGYYDMILMDIQMPVMNGLDATWAIRQLDRQDVKIVPIVAMSANAFSEDIIKSRNAGMNDHIAKPIHLKKLLDVMEYYLEKDAPAPKKRKEKTPETVCVQPARYYEELFFVDGTTALSAENEKTCIDVLDRNGAVGIFGLFEQQDFPIYCVSGFALTALGYTYEQLMKVSRGFFINLVHPEDREKFMGCFYERGHKHHYRLIGNNNDVKNVVSYTMDTYACDGKRIRMASVRVE